jgi:di/tricarboxylate transporter
MTIFLILGVIAVAFICFVTEWLPADITAIALMVLLMILGLVTPEEGISGFGNSATVTVMAMFILSAGIARTGALQIVSNLLLKLGGKCCTRQILVMGAIIAPISGFINNTAVVAIFLPIVEDWCRKCGISVSKMLIPLSYITVLGGMSTVIGTSTNVLASSLSEQLGYGAFGLFQFTELGLISAVIGLIYIALVAPRVLPDRIKTSKNSVVQEYSLKDYVSEVVVTPRSNLVGQTLISSGLEKKLDVDVLELIHNDCYFPQPVGDKVLQAGDILLIRCSREDLLKIKNEEGIDIVPDVSFRSAAIEANLNFREEGIAEVLIISNSDLIGSTLKEINFRQRYNATVLAIRWGQEFVSKRLSTVPLRFGDVLLVQGPKQSLLGLQTSRRMLVIEQQDLEVIRRDKAAIVVVICLGVVLVAAFNWLPIMVSALIGVVLMVLTGCLKPSELYGAIRWDIIFLLAGLIPLGIAMEKSGATQWLANNLVAMGRDVSGYWVLTFFFITTSIITEILSNNATVVLMLPVAAEVAKNLHLNPFAFIFAVTFAASNSFITPIGYQTNMMVYGPGGYKFLDFVCIGTPLNLMMTLIIPPLIILLYGL